MPITRIAITVIKTIARNKRIAPWKYRDLETTPWLYGSDYLKEMVNDAIKYKDKESLKYIAKYIKRFDCGDIKTYKYILGKIAKHIDISDFF